MAMNIGAGRPHSDINVTPLIDVVLVLLIIFMVLTPMVQRGYDMSIPDKAPATVDPPPTQSEQIIVSITPDGRILLNKEQTALEAVKGKLEDLLRGRREKMVFFAADDAVIYQLAISVMDAIRAAGGTVGLVTTDLPK